MREGFDHEDAVLLYRSGELEAADRSAFEAHLAVCAGCAAALSAAREASRLAEKALLEAPPPAGIRFSWGWAQRTQAAAAGLGVAFAAAAVLLVVARAPRAPLPASAALDAQLSELDGRLRGLDDQLTRDQSDVEYEQEWNDLSRTRATLESELARPEGA